MSEKQAVTAAKTDNEAAPAKATKPKSARRWAREFAVQALYELFVAGHEVAAVRLRTEGEPISNGPTRISFASCGPGVTTDTDALIVAVQPHVDRPFEQVSPIERSIILDWRLGASAAARHSVSCGNQ